VNSDVAIGDPDHKTFQTRISGILKSGGIEPEVVVRREATLTRQAVEELMKLCEGGHHTCRGSVYWQFVIYQISRRDRSFVTRWLLKRFALEVNSALRSNIETIFLNQRDLILREFADEVIQLLKEPRYGDCRSGMIYYLAKLKHPQAAELIASVMNEGQLAWSALRFLGELKARQYEAEVRKYLRDPDSEIRLEAKRALKKMGCEIEKSPPPIHLVRNRKLPKGLAEWSANLDFEDLERVLKTLAACIEEGFTGKEAAEAIGVAEEMRPEQTKAFRFPIAANGNAGELWLMIFMDDVDSPDVQLHAAPELIRKFEAKVDLTD
jgi:hypothetical protein